MSIRSNRIQRVIAHKWAMPLMGAFVIFTFCIAAAIAGPAGTNSTVAYSNSTGPVIKGTLTGTSGQAIYGYASATSGTTYGLYGWSYSSSGKGVYGVGSTGVYGTGATGVWGKGTGGVLGLNSGVFGEGTASGIYGRSSSSYGGYFEGGSYGSSSTASYTTGRAVYGEATASSGTTYGVYGKAISTSGYGVYSYGKMAATGTKSAIVRTSQGPTEMYTEESTEIWFSDYGEGQLVNGRAHIVLDTDFLETVTINPRNPMKVFVQLEGEARGVYVEKGLTAFEVIELQEGQSNAPFSYRVVAKRQGYEDQRMQIVDVDLDGEDDEKTRQIREFIASQQEQ